MHKVTCFCIENNQEFKGNLNFLTSNYNNLLNIYQFEDTTLPKDNQYSNGVTIYFNYDTNKLMETFGFHESLNLQGKTNYNLTKVENNNILNCNKNSFTQYLTNLKLKQEL